MCPIRQKCDLTHNYPRVMLTELLALTTQSMISNITLLAPEPCAPPAKVTSDGTGSGPPHQSTGSSRPAPQP